MIGILVRDEAAREELRGQVGDIGLIMYVDSFKAHHSTEVVS